MSRDQGYRVIDFLIGGQSIKSLISYTYEQAEKDEDRQDSIFGENLGVIITNKSSGGVKINLPTDKWELLAKAIGINADAISATVDYAEEWQLGENGKKKIMPYPASQLSRVHLKAGNSNRFCQEELTIKFPGKLNNKEGAI